MTIAKFTGITVGAVAVGAYLRWATGPVLGAYRLGRNLTDLAK